ncbi:phage head-tail connector protein [Eupransor demetentiae]|uniref:Uncharacterized protein n=1 Tax=Eupransor demetentiae TaxID=3109584 RepID=A0ABP0ESG3_9LACO|nr:hypothetical protein R54876_GBNLAHCA_00682 [Lactobacillaceae bacterium LMG 33000]
MTVAKRYAKLVSNTVSVEDKLDILEEEVRNRLAVLLGIEDPTRIPTKFDYIVNDVTASRFSRIGNEGMKSSSQDGLTMTFRDNDFDPYMKEINAYRDKDNYGPRRGRAIFY